MMTQLKAAAILAFAAFTAAQTLDHPTLSQGSDDLSPENEAACPEHSYTITPYDAGMIPSDCKDIANSESLNPADFESFYVTYDDCADPWIFCRHKDDVVSIDELATGFGKTPVGMRDFVKHVLGLPDAGGAFNSGGNVAVKGDAAKNVFNVWLHESAHSLDGQGGFDNTVQGSFTDSQEWLDAYNADTNVPDEYSQTNQAENIAQETVLAVYDKIVDGGIAKIRPNWMGVQNQLKLVESKAGDKIIPGGTCNRALQPSGPVPIDGTTSRIMARNPHKFSQKYSNLREPRPFDSRPGK